MSFQFLDASNFCWYKVTETWCLKKKLLFTVKKKKKVTWNVGWTVQVETLQTTKVRIIGQIFLYQLWVGWCLYDLFWNNKTIWNNEVFLCTSWIYMNSVHDRTSHWLFLPNSQKGLIDCFMQNFSQTKGTWKLWLMKCKTLPKMNVILK